LGLACTDDTGPDSGALTVITATSGTGSDADGYRLTVDRVRREQLDAIDTVRIDGLTVGTHELELEGIGSGCQLTGPSSRSVDVSRVAVDSVRFEVTCASDAGMLEIRTTTDGTDLDRNGYVLVLNGSAALSVNSNALVSATVAAGAYQATLADVSDNCTIDGPAERDLSVSTAGIVRVEFNLHCVAKPPAGHGHEIAFLRNGGPDDVNDEQQRLYLMNDDGSNIRQLPVNFGMPQSGPTWIAGGDRLGFFAAAPDLESAPSLFTLDLTSGAIDLLRQSPINRYAHWSPDGSSLVFVDFFCPTDECFDAIRITGGDGVDRPNDVFVSSETMSLYSPIWWSNGTEILFIQSSSTHLGGTLARMQRDGSGVTPFGPDLTSRFSVLDDLAASPDGSRLTFTGLQVDDQFQLTSAHVYLMDVAGHEPVQLTFGSSLDGMATWSPDGQRLAFVSNRDGNFEIYVMDANGDNQTRLTDDPADDLQPAWRP
jgi:Tol biopolymer transport system component